jgi:multicomponent Na+:H+ antiporter subunit D
MPLTMAAFVVGGLALIGLPLTTGFVSKWYLVEASLEQGDWLVAELILISSLIALIYVWRVVEAAYFQPPSHSARQAREAPAVLLIPTWTLILAGVYFGIHTSLTRGVAQDAAETLLRGTGSG